MVAKVKHKTLLRRIVDAYFKCPRISFFIQGPPGIGKSWTVRDAARHIAERLAGGSSSGTVSASRRRGRYLRTQRSTSC